MKPHHFEVNHDDEGEQFIHKLSSEATKNHQGDIVEDFEPEGGRIYATGTVLCPVASFIKYLGKLNPNCDTMWQRPRDSYDVNDSCWYEKKPLGKNLLAVMMTQISESANLSEKYTNHCVKATCITVLSESGFEARQIVTVSGHRNEQSVQNYVCDTSTAQKRSMSASLSSFTTNSLEQNSATSTTNETENAADHNTELNYSDTELVNHYDSLIQSIQRGDAELQPLPIYDITNVLPPQDTAPMNRKDSKASILFHNCQATIHNLVSS